MGTRVWRSAALTGSSGNNKFAPLGESAYPTGPAGGDLSGAYPNPAVAAVTANNIQLLIQAIADGQMVVRSGLSLLGMNVPTIPTSLPPSGPAGGDLSGNYPNPTVTAKTGNPYVDKPAIANAMDDEFDSGSSDFATRGWTITAGGVAAVRDGDIVPNDVLTIPAAGHYRSTRVGSVMFVQCPASAQGLFIYKAIPSGTQQSNYAARARILGGYQYNKNNRRIIGFENPSLGGGTGAVWLADYFNAAGVPQYWWIGTDNVGGASAWGIGPTNYPSGAQRSDVLMFCRQGSYAYGAAIDSASGSCEYANNARTGLSYSLTHAHQYWGCILSTDVAAPDAAWDANIFAIDYLRFTDATVLTPQSGWFG